jgi:hypothetical protein
LAEASDELAFCHGEPTGTIVAPLELRDFKPSSDFSEKHERIEVAN